MKNKRPRRSDSELTSDDDLQGLVLDEEELATESCVQIERCEFSKSIEDIFFFDNFENGVYELIIRKIKF